MGTLSVDDETRDLVAVQKTLSGNPEAFRTIVEAYQKRLYQFCLVRLGDSDAASDAAQEILIRAYKSLTTFKMGRNFRAWIFSIAFHHLYSGWKRKKRDEEKLQRSYYPEEVGATNPEETLLSLENAQELQRALGKLKKEQATVLYLHYFEGLSVADIAATLHIGEENVKTRLFRGRKKLRELLEKSQPTFPWGGIGI